MNSQDYWKLCLGEAADECKLSLSPEQLEYLAEAAQGGHENYGMAFYSPPASDRISVIESEWKARLNAAQKEHERYTQNAESAIKKALHIYSDSVLTIGDGGEVVLHGGRDERIL